MDEQDNSRLNSDEKFTSKLIIEEIKPEKAAAENSQTEPEPQLEVENNTEVFTEPENGNEVITIVAQENDGQIFIYDGNENDQTPAQEATEFIQVCDSNSNYEEVNNSDEKEVNVDGLDEDENETVKEVEENIPKEATIELTVEATDCEVTQNPEGNGVKNYKSVILDDWEVEVPQVMENNVSENYSETVVISEEPEIIETQEVITYNNDNHDVVEVTALDNVEIVKENSKEENSVEIRSEEELAKLAEKKLESLKFSKSISKNEIVKILDESSERFVRPIVTGKDLFFSIELTKRLNQKLQPLNKSKVGDGVEKNTEKDSCNNNNTMDDRQKIVEILEAEEVKDWKSVATHSDLNSKENGNDMEISKAIQKMEEVDRAAKLPVKSTAKKNQVKKFRTMDKELERSIALQQLREEFPSTRKRSRATKKVNHIPFLASTVVEKALTSPEVTTALKPGPPRRRPCYLPENVAYSKSKEEAEAKAKKGKGNKNDGEIQGGESVEKVNSDLPEPEPEVLAKKTPNSVVKTYSVKRKSTDAENDIKSTLETIAAVTKALSENAEETGESKPKKQKTVITKSENKSKNKVLVKKKKKLKSGSTNEKKMKSELEKLLGDEGAVRMLYDTQNLDTSSSPPKRTKFKTTTGLKKDLQLKTKLVKNAVMRLSGVGADGVFLRGQRRSHKLKPKAAPSPKEEEPLFSSTPNIVLYKPKKKQRAEASRILYRHSSSESFDSSEGYRRTSFDADGLNVSVKEGPTSTSEKTEEHSSLFPEKSPAKAKQKSEILMKRKLKRLERAKSLAQKSDASPPKLKGKSDRMSTESQSVGGSKLNLSIVPVRKSSRPRMVSKKYSIWSSTSMDSLLGLKKVKKASTELGKKLNCKELTIMQYEHLVQVILTPVSTLLKNSVDHTVLQELLQVFTYLSKEDSCRVVLVSSRGSTFCQGVDINRIISYEDSEREEEISRLIESIREFIICLASFNKPVIAGVQGPAVGLGVTLLPYCDLVISSDTASFYTPYVKLGQAPEGAPTHTFPRISRFLVSELLFKSQKMSAVDALKYGLVTQVIPEDRFEEDLIMISRNMASQSTEGMQSVKFLLRSGSEQEEISEALRLEGELLQDHWRNAESLNNMIRFLNSGELQLKKLTT